MRIGDRIVIRSGKTGEILHTGLIIWFHDWLQDVWLVRLDGFSVGGCLIHESVMEVVS